MTFEELTKAIQQIAEEYTTHSIKLYNRVETKIELETKLCDLIYECMEKVMKITLEYIYDTYHINVTPLTKEQLHDLFYHQDGKTLEERIHEYTKLNKPAFIYRICLFFDTETIVIRNKLTFIKLKDEFKWITIVSGPGCEKCCNLSIFGWIRTEDFKMSNMPPFHPNCHCGIAFSQTRDEEEDLKN